MVALVSVTMKGRGNILRMIGTQPQASKSKQVVNGRNISSAILTVPASSSTIISNTTHSSCHNSLCNNNYINKSGAFGLSPSSPPSVSKRYMGNWPKIMPRKLRLITMDVTGTIVSFRGTLEQHYLGAAAKCGITPEDVNASKISESFNRAYKETSIRYPCFGGDEVSAKQWWRECVVKSFRIAGVHMDEITEEHVFQRIYSTFGSNAAYEIFPDALPFLKWARRNGLVCGVLSNADERYGDSILPMLGLTHDELQFQVYSKDVKLEKPDPRVFMAAIKHGEPFLQQLPDGSFTTTTRTASSSPGMSNNNNFIPVETSEVLHIGNDFNKDFEGARRIGIHSVLLDRYKESEKAEEWRRRGAPVFRDLMDVIEYLGRADCEFGTSINSR